MLSIIIPTYNNREYLEECLEAIILNTKDYEIIIVDNGSTEPIPFGQHTVVRNETNMGFPIAINQGLRVAKGDYLCILNNDCVVSKNWFSYMLDHFNDGADMIGPMTNKISGPQQALVSVYRNMEELNKVATIFHANNYHKYQEFYRLVGFCLVFRRKVLETVGYFDEQYSPGNFEDDDFCLSAIEHGFHLRICNDIFVHHYGSFTHRIMDLDYNELLKVNSKKFMAKWKDKIDGTDEILGLLKRKEKEYGTEKSF